MEATELLALFGLTRIEASLYIDLLSCSGRTGYEASKETGVSRSNAYTALASLCEKGAANIIEGTPVKYVAVPIKEFCKKRIVLMESAAEQLSTLLPNDTAAGDGYVTVSGSANIIGRIHSILENAQLRVYFSVNAEHLSEFTDDLKALANDGRKVVVITDAPADIDGVKVLCASARGSQIRLTADSCRVLTGELTDSKECTCLYSDKEHVVRVVKDSLKYELQLIRYGYDTEE